MFGRAVWDKFLKCIFEHFEIAPVKLGQFQNFQKSQGWLSQKLLQPNMWLLVNYTKPTSPLYWNYLLSVGNYKSASRQLENSGQLQNNTINGAMLIATSFVIIEII